MPIVPGTTEPVETLEDAREDRRGDRLPDRGQGGGRRRRQGLPRRARARQARRTPSRAPRARARSSSPTRPSTSSATCPTRATSRSRCWPTSTATSIHLGERDCSIQRRHQKLIEESPGAAGRRRAARADRQDRRRRRQGRRLPLGRHDRGPAPGRRVLLPRDEHARAGRALRDRGGRPGIDIVREQILIAAGEPLSFAPGRRRRCAATRSSAASTPRTPRRTSPPRPARSPHYREPSGPGVRVDSGVLSGSEITPLYDPMVAKLIVWDADRERATRADAARAGRVRDRGRHDPDPVPQGDHGLRAVGQGARPAAT